ncbi:MAG: cation:proton antiporter [Actinomycetota bacterium]|nr:cation:proton antiporter [Actinomycetota bacterium]
MTDSQPFAVLLLLGALVGLAALLSNRLTATLKVPAPGLLLIAAAIAVKLVPALHAPPEVMVERIATVALLCILFDGGLHIGWTRFRSAWAPITLAGVPGTFLTAAAGAVLLHVAFGLGWYPALLVATAVAPTDPAMVFSVLGQKEVAGRSGTILEGESGANDPAGIALMAGLITAGGLTGSTFGQVGVEFLLQMGIGAAVGLVGGRALIWFIQRVPLPSEGLYPLRTLASAFVLFGAAVLAHGSGFLAVFVAGIVAGDARAPYKREIERFHGALASLGEIAVFIVLGLTVDLRVIGHSNVWIPGLIFAAALTLVIRPLFVGLCLGFTPLRRNERVFVLFAGLKGAVPILLGSFILTANLADAERLYGIVIVVVVISVIVQGALIPGLTRLLRLPVRNVEPEPWALGMRLRREPEGVHQFTVAAGSPADGNTLRELSALAVDMWITMLVRNQKPIAVTGSTVLRAGDNLLVMADAREKAVLVATFERRRDGDTD